MSDGSISQQVHRIMHSMASLPGGRSITLTTRNFAYFSPGGGLGNSYREDSRSFEPGALPESVEVRGEAEEVVIQLHGALTEPTDQACILQPLRRMLHERPMHVPWDVRAKMVGAGGYEVTVFGNPRETMPA